MISNATRSRRSFLSGAATIAAGALLEGSALRGFADPLGWPLGFQGYDARFLLIQDWDKGWNIMRQMGYRAVDMVSFQGYGYQKSPLASFTASKIRDKLDEVGMLHENCQFGFDELHDHFDDKMEFARTLGLKFVICAPSPDHMKTIDDWKWQADQFNSLGKRVKAAGFSFGYHNHDVEFMDVDGQTPYDVLMERTEPELVQFQIDVGNLTFGGKDAVQYLTRYGHRYFSMHAKDYLPGKTSVPVGQGILDWHKIFNIVKKQTTIHSCYAEVAAYGIGSLHGANATPWPSDSIDELRQSADYLKKLKV